MKLRSSAPALSRLRSKDWHVDIMLPDLREIDERARGVPQIGAVTAQYALRALEIWQSGSQMALGNIVQSIGVPAFNIFKELVEQFKIDPVADVTAKLEDVYGTVSAALSQMQSNPSDGGQAMTEAAGAGVSTGVSMVTAVPVVGMVVRLAWNVGMLTLRIAQLAKQSQDYGAVERIYPPSRFLPSADRDVLNTVLLDTVRAKSDWTKLFSPPSMGTGVGTLPPYATKNTEFGVEIFRRHGYDEDGLPINWGNAGWLGMVPGSATLHSGIAVTSTAAEEIGSSMFPSARGIGTWLWKQVTSKDPLAAIFTVHADAMSGAWSGYIHQLHEFINETDKLNVDQKARVMERMNGDSSGTIFGWGSSIAPVANEWDHYGPTVVGDALRARQFKACDTLLIAYVDESFGAFQDEQLLERFKQRRKQLLEHPAVCDVRLDDVVDEDYKEALRSAGAGSGSCAQIRPWFTIGELPDGFKPEDDTGSGGSGGLGGLGPAPTRKRGLGMLGALLLAAGGYAAYRQLR